MPRSALPPSAPPWPTVARYACATDTSSAARRPPPTTSTGPDHDCRIVPVRDRRHRAPLARVHAEPGLHRSTSNASVALELPGRVRPVVLCSGNAVAARARAVAAAAYSGRSFDVSVPLALSRTTTSWSGGSGRRPGRVRLSPAVDQGAGAHRSTITSAGLVLARPSACSRWWWDRTGAVVRAVLLVALGILMDAFLCGRCWCRRGRAVAVELWPSAHARRARSPLRQRLAGTYER